MIIITTCIYSVHMMRNPNDFYLKKKIEFSIVGGRDPCRCGSWPWPSRCYYLSCTNSFR